MTSQASVVQKIPNINKIVSDLLDQESRGEKPSDQQYDELGNYLVDGVMVQLLTFDLLNELITVIMKHFELHRLNSSFNEDWLELFRTIHINLGIMLALFRHARVCYYWIGIMEEKKVKSFIRFLMLFSKKAVGLVGRKWAWLILYYLEKAVKRASTSPHPQEQKCATALDFLSPEKWLAYQNHPFVMETCLHHRRRNTDKKGVALS